MNILFVILNLAFTLKIALKKKKQKPPLSPVTVFTMNKHKIRSEAEPQKHQLAVFPPKRSDAMNIPFVIEIYECFLRISFKKEGNKNRH